MDIRSVFALFLGVFLKSIAKFTFINIQIPPMTTTFQRTFYLYPFRYGLPVFLPGRNGSKCYGGKKATDGGMALWPTTMLGCLRACLKSLKQMFAFVVEKICCTYFSALKYISEDCLKFKESWMFVSLYAEFNESVSPPPPREQSYRNTLQWSPLYLVL